MSGSGGLCEPELPKQSVLASARAPSTDSVTHKVSDGTQGSLYKMGRYKEALTAVLDCLTCPQCKEIFTDPVTLDCGHTVCWDCAEKTGSENKEGQRCCCCPKCGEESVTEDLVSRVNLTLLDVAAVVHGHAGAIGKGRSPHEVSSDWDSGAGDIMSEYSVGSSCSIRSINTPPYMASKGELFDRMSLLTDGQESVDELSQRSSGSSVCSEREQPSDDEASARRTLSGSGGLCDSKLPLQRACTPSRAPSTTSDGTQTSVYDRGWLKQALLHMLDRLTCPHCKDILLVPVTLDCGHSVCLSCARKIVSKNKEGQRCCCCPKCEEESVTEDLWSRVNRTLWGVAAVVRGHAASLGKGRSASVVSSAGDSENRMGDIRTEYSVGSAWSTSSMIPPPVMVS